MYSIAFVKEVCVKKNRPLGLQEIYFLYHFSDGHQSQKAFNYKKQSINFIEAKRE